MGRKDRVTLEGGKAYDAANNPDPPVRRRSGPAAHPAVHRRQRQAVTQPRCGKLHDASRTAVETFLDLFRDYNAFDNPQYYFRKSFHAANRAILRELGDEGYGAASVGVAMIRENWLFYAVVGNVKLCVFRNGDLVPVSAGHTLDVLAEQSFRTGRLSREDALVMLENHRLYNYLGQDSFKDIEIFDRPISLQRGDIIVLMSDGLYELIPWKEIEDVLSGGQDCQSMAYALMEKVNQNSAEDRDNASVILLRWDGSTT